VYNAAPMLKTVFAVIAGYLVMALFVMVSSVVAFTALGADRAYRAGTFEPTGVWIITVLALGFIAAMVGGYVCAIITASPAAPKALAIAVFGLGLLFALPVFRPPVDPQLIRTSDMPLMQTISAGRQPAWVALLLPVVGAAGVLAGARRHKRH
jgi:hypothetical protein